MSRKLAPTKRLRKSRRCFQAHRLSSKEGLHLVVETKSRAVMAGLVFDSRSHSPDSQSHRPGDHFLRLWPQYGRYSAAQAGHSLGNDNVRPSGLTSCLGS